MRVVINALPHTREELLIIFTPWFLLRFGERNELVAFAAGHRGGMFGTAISQEIFLSVCQAPSFTSSHINYHVAEMYDMYIHQSLPYALSFHLEICSRIWTTSNKHSIKPLSGTKTTPTQTLLPLLEVLEAHELSLFINTNLSAPSSPGLSHTSWP